MFARSCQAVPIYHNYLKVSSVWRIQLLMLKSGPNLLCFRRNSFPVLSRKGVEMSSLGDLTLITIITAHFSMKSIESSIISKDVEVEGWSRITLERL
jgi:hypothetical protein